MVLPDFLTHYSRGEPFRSITSAGHARWPEIVAGLSEANCWGLERFSDPDYLTRRVEVEAGMRAELLERGGQPALEHPSYWLLGRDPRWERPKGPGLRAYTVPLASLPALALSVTFGDSLVCRHPENLALWRAAGHHTHPWSGRMFLLHELAGLSPRDLEVQLWVLPPAEAVQTFELPWAPP